MFHFRFWLCGQWTDVVVDDYLPFDENNNFIFCHDKKNSNEMWSCLLEKAYAKYIEFFICPISPLSLLLK